MTSLRRRLALALVCGLLAAGSLASAGLYWLAMEEITAKFDDRLSALSWMLTPETIAAATVASLTEDGQLSDGIVVQVWTVSGALRVHTDRDVAPFPHHTQFSDLQQYGREWRSYSRDGGRGLILQIAQATDIRRSLAAKAALRLLLPLLVLLALLAGFIGWIVSRQLRPLRQLAAQINSHSADHEGRMILPDAPTELMPVITALNDLLKRQSDASERRKKFLADAAHALRTPLAVVSLQTQHVQQAVSDADRREALTTLQGGVDRATRLVKQLLELSRSDRSSHQAAQIRPLVFDELLRHTLAELHPLAVDKRIDLGLTYADPCWMQADADALHSLIANLIDNAIRYTPAGGRVDVSLTLAGGHALLIIRDSGPGIPSDRRDQLFRRFVRAGNADSTGSGLGLAIARQVVERHAGDIVLEDAAVGLGLVVRIRLPATSPVV